MKACIITVYNSENCGSFWQAYALKAYLENKGISTCFLRRSTENTSHDKKIIANYIIKAILKGKFSRVKRYLDKYQNFENVIKRFAVVDSVGSDIDFCVFGSDTIWELKDSYFDTQKDVYWGKSINCNHKIAYAPSMGNSDIGDLVGNETVLTSLDTFDAVGVRDNHSRTLLQQHTKKNIELVCDPTLLVDKTLYSECKNQFKEKYLLVYYFGKMSKLRQDEILDFARKSGLKVFSFGEGMEHCDQKLTFDPFLFVDAFRQADYVVTNTFHGTVFSLIFEKSFVVFAKGRQKIKELLSVVKLEDRAIEDAELTCKFSENIDYATANSYIELYRNNSRNFLDQAIEGVKRCQ